MMIEASVSQIVVSSSFVKGLSKTLAFFFRLAWVSRVRLPAYLTFIFLAADLRLSVEIIIGDDMRHVRQEEIGV